MISFEAGLVGVQHGGIGREAESLLRALQSEAIPLTLLTWPGQTVDSLSHAVPRQISRPLPRRIALGIALLMKRALTLRTPDKSTLFLPQVLPFKQKRSHGPIVVRLHDLFPITHPEWFTAKASALFKISLDQLVKNRAYFLCDSRSSELELLALHPSARSLGVLHCYIPPFTESKECGDCLGCTFDATKKFFIAVGTIEPRKNYNFLVELVTSAPEIRIAVVGRPGWKSEATLSSLRNTGGIHYLEKVCDGSLKKLYENAGAFLSPSLDEGFNIPAFEAKRFGLPLILSDIPVHREMHPHEKLLGISNTSGWITALRGESYEKTVRELPSFADYSKSLVERLNGENPLL